MKLFSAAQDTASEYSGILSRLRRNTSGNTLAMIAMATIPLVGMVGSAVDMGRSYLIKSRLQQACDAGALATRRSMSGTVIDASSAAQGVKFFNINFAANTSGSTNVSFTTASTADGQVAGTATARIPMTITKIFGNDYVDLSLQCNARLEISNTDVMFVLDTTGSMLDCPDDSYCNGNANSKIAGVRSAVVNFYDTINNATTSTARFRLGFVPYSSAVNVGIDPFTTTNILPSNWMVSNWTYQSRVANMTTPGWHPTTSYGGWTNQTYGSPISDSSCTNYGNNVAFSGFNPSPSGNPTVPTSDVFQSGQPSTVNQTFYQRVSSSYGGVQTCTRQYLTATTSYAQSGRFSFTSWSYMPVSYDVSSFKSGTSVNVYTSSSVPAGSVSASGAYNMADLVNSPGSTVTGSVSAYSGCVEERDTVPNTTFPTIPPGAYDLDILTVPSSTATSWRPMWADLMYNRNGLGNETNVGTSRSPLSISLPSVYSTCPAAASKLAVRAHSDVQNYVNTLAPGGGTYHDVGMAWGARMISPTGIWASENTTAPNGQPISRHIIFMTDGIMSPDALIYGAHAYETLDRRVMASTAPTSGPSGNMAPVHTERFLALCRAAQANNITVWTVAFGTQNPPTLVSCASPGKSFIATNTAQLQAQFQSIASQIAALRISK